MTIRRAGRARARALVVPALMSAALWLVVGELALGRYGPAVLLMVLPFLAAAANTRKGERLLAHLVLRARAPRLHQRHTLATVAEILLRQGVPPDQVLLLVRPGRQVDATAVGRRAVVVSRGLVEAVRSGHLAPRAAASVITHELGVLRAGLTRHDPGVMVLLAPWKVWLTFILIMWGIAATFLSHRLMVACLVINAGVGVWLGATEDPVMYASTAVMTVVLGTWWAIRSWERAREQVGDRYLLQTGLAGVYADLLTASFDDDYARDRAVRLRYPQPHCVPPVVPEASPAATAVLSTTGHRRSARGRRRSPHRSGPARPDRDRSWHGQPPTTPTALHRYARTRDARGP
ncbi:hypothetical protein LVO85_01040 [Ornithinimicrobium sp. EGI L100131]|uniref:hypothetical protein n=1 Tax=Ornithinimicrobium sediminis TaxID=2904603 RepID=UPI001E3E9C47|nr:hypothetical protein [Ornithinimicrobium sediminis]MCE0485430.1 hypothetical protein [Ornithinimicrobium sediminis]